jgi:bifunctional polynucleotide phosphatase/kinase
MAFVCIYINVDSPFPEETVASSFFTPASKKKPESIAWRIVNNSLIVGKFSPESNQERKASDKPRIAAFDFVCFSG